MTKKKAVLIIIPLLIIMLSFVLMYNLHFPSKDKKQVDFIKDFVSSFVSSDRDVLVRSKLFDKGIIKDVSDFEWYRFCAVSLKSAYQVKKDESPEISECVDYLSKTYSKTNIEVFKVSIKRVQDYERKVVTEYSDDVFYLTNKDGEYYLLYTQSLFKK